MSIAAAVEAALAPRSCKFGRILQDLPGPDLQAILDGLEGSLSYKDASRILTANGFPVGDDVIREHDKNACCCKDAA